MKFLQNVTIAMAASALAVFLAGCPQKEGPGEKAGKAVDKAVDKAGQQMEKAGENVRDAAKGDKK
jgi:hypothetical protein